MRGYFDQAVAFTLKNEGGFVDDPADRGGATNFGITQRTLNAWRYSKGLSLAGVEILVPATAQEIYFDLYWKPFSFSEISLIGPAIAIFDAGVLFGTGAGILGAQRALIATGYAGVTVDGTVGARTLEALNSTNPSFFLRVFVAQLALHIADVCAKRSQDVKFQRGWTDRVKRYLTLS